MASFDSPNFKKNIPSQTQRPLREFTVGNPEDFQDNQQLPQEMSQAELEEAVREARKQKLANANRIGDAAKKRIEILADIGRLTRDVNIGGFSFSLRTLKSKEMREAALSTFSTALTQAEASYEARKQQLARSLFKIDGEDIATIIGSNTIEDKMSFVEDNLEDIVVDKLWNEFVLLKEEAKTKYGISNDKEAQEVIEDLKK